MAELNRYVCKECGHTIETDPHGHYGLMAGAIAACMYPIPDYIAERFNNILTDDLRDIKDRFLEMIEDKT